jgi:anti-anti-sigma regulatory factor
MQHPSFNGGEVTPPASIPARLSAHLISVSHAIAGVQDEQGLADALSSVMVSCNIDAYHLWRGREAPEPFMEAVVAWDRSGEPNPPAGTRVPRAGFRVLGEITPERPLIAADAAADPRLDEAVRRAAVELGVRSIGLYPLVERAEVFGILDIKYRTERHLEPGEVQFFRSLAGIAAMALLHVDSQAALQRKIRQLKGLYDVAESISTIPSSKAIIEKTANLLFEVGYVNCFIAIADESANLLREEALVGAGDFPGRPHYEFPLDALDITPVSAFHAGRPMVFADMQRRADAEGWGDVARKAGMRSAAYVPLRAGGKVMGVLSFGSSDAHISSDELSLLGAFGNQLASTISRVEMNIERDKQLAALEQANANQARLLETVRELSTPVIPVHDGVLVLPLVGMIDTTRSAQVMEALLNAIQKERAQVVIIDITGVPTVDTGVANHLMRSTRAASLLGAMCVLVGVAPAVAQTLVQLGIDFGELVTRSDLQAGIAYALDRLGAGAQRR